MGSPYKFNSNGAAEIFGALSGQFVKNKKRKEQAEKKDPNSLQNKANRYLNNAAKEATAKLKGIAKEDAAATKAAAKAAKDKKDRAAATRRATADHKVRLARAAEFEDLKTQKQVERAKALAEAKGAGKPATPVAKPAAPKSASRKTPSGVSTDKDGVLKPVNPPKKPAAKTRMAVDTKAGDMYND
jgi:hypothetical protein